MMLAPLGKHNKSQEILLYRREGKETLEQKRTRSHRENFLKGTMLETTLNLLKGNREIKIIHFTSIPL